MAIDNVPFIGPRSRYEILGTKPTRLVHTMATGNLDGTRPTTALVTDPADLDPTVEAGKATWDGLNHGGLFYFANKPVVIESLSTGTWEIVEETTPNTFVVTRSTPTTFPFKLSPGEKLRISGVASAIVVARMDVLTCI